MGAGADCITRGYRAKRHRQQLRAGRALDGALPRGFKGGLRVVDCGRTGRRGCLQLMRLCRRRTSLGLFRCCLLDRCCLPRLDLLGRRCLGLLVYLEPQSGIDLLWQDLFGSSKLP